MIMKKTTVYHVLIFKNLGFPMPEQILPLLNNPLNMKL